MQLKVCDASDGRDEANSSHQQGSAALIYIGNSFNRIINARDGKITAVYII